MAEKLVQPSEYMKGILIWANHQLRSSTLAMQQVCRDLAQNHSIKDSPMVSVKEIFRLQEQDKLNEDEKNYE